MAKSPVMQAMQETIDLLERWGEYMRDGHMVQGYPTGRCGRGAVMDDDMAALVEEAVRSLMVSGSDADYMFIAVCWYYRGEKRQRMTDGVPVTYFVQRNYLEIGNHYKRGDSWAQTLVTAGVAVVHGYLRRAKLEVMREAG